MTGPRCLAGAGDRGSVPGGLLLLLVEHLHEAGGRLLIGPRSYGCGPETVAAEPAVQLGERLDVSGRGSADLEPDGKGTHPVGDRVVKIPERAGCQGRRGKFQGQGSAG
jgi:hypothetical protein